MYLLILFEPPSWSRMCSWNIERERLSASCYVIKQLIPVNLGGSPHWSRKCLARLGWGYASCWYCVRICLAPVFVAPLPSLPPKIAWHVNWGICHKLIQIWDLEVGCPLRCSVQIRSGAGCVGLSYLKTLWFFSKNDVPPSDWCGSRQINFVAASEKSYVCEWLKSNDSILFHTGITPWVKWITVA